MRSAGEMRARMEVMVNRITKDVEYHIRKYRMRMAMILLHMLLLSEERLEAEAWTCSTSSVWTGTFHDYDMFHSPAFEISSSRIESLRLFLYTVILGLPLRTCFCEVVSRPASTQLPQSCHKKPDLP